MEFGDSQLVNGSNNILRADNENYVKRRSFCHSAPIKLSDGGNLANRTPSFWLRKDSGCSPPAADIPIPLLKRELQESEVAVVQTKKVRKTKTSGITKEDLIRLFDKSCAVAAAELEICESSLRSKCRQFGIKQWPYKKKARGSSFLGNYYKKTLPQTDFNATILSMEDLSSTLTSEDDYGAEIMGDQYPAQVYEPTFLDTKNGAATDELSSLPNPKEDESGGKIMDDDQTLMQVFESSSLVEPEEASATEYQTNQNMAAADYGFWEQYFRLLG